MRLLNKCIYSIPVDSSGEEDEDDGPMSTVIPKRLQDSRQAATTTTTTVLSLVVGRAQLSLCTDVAGPTEVKCYTC